MRVLAAFWTNLSLKRKGLVVVAIPAVPLLILGLFSYQNRLRAEEAYGWVALTLVQKAELTALETALTDAENDVRGFLLTRNPTWLDEYRAATTRVVAAYKRLDSLLIDTPQRASLQRLVQMAKDRPLSTLLRHHSNSADALVPHDVLARSTAAMAALRGEIGVMQRRSDTLLGERNARVRAALGAATWLTVSGAAFGLAGGVCAVLLFTTGVSRRVERLEENARLFGERRPLLEFPGGNDEVGRLGQRLAYAAHLLNDRERQLDDRVAELHAVNQELEAFSYSVSHDLRAPLRHVTGFASIVMRRESAALSPEGARQLRTIVDAATKMGQLIDDLLVFSRMGRAEMSATRIRLDDLVDDVRRELSVDCAGREVTWVVEPLPDVVGDPAMLRLAITNLLANAVKYTRGRSPAAIHIGVTDAGPDEVVLFIRDNGAGFDMKYADKLFGVFQRLHGADEFEGTGIGLANVRRIVTRHGGRVWAEGSPGQGATFSVSLPRAASNAAAPEAATRDAECLDLTPAAPQLSTIGAL